MRTLLPLLLIFFCALDVQAQDEDIKTVLRDYLSTDKDIKDGAILELYQDVARRKLADQQTDSALRRMADVSESRRMDRQLAAPAGPSGATALTALTGASDILSAAMESGVVDRATEGSIATFRINASAGARFLSPQQPCFLRSDDCKPTAEQRLKSLSLAVSFDQSVPEAEDPMTTAAIEGSDTPIPAGAMLPGLSRRGELRNFTARWEFRRRKSLADANVQNAWRKVMLEVRGKANDLGGAGNAYLEALHASESWKLWKAASLAKLDEIAASNLSEDEKLARMMVVYKEDLASFAATADPSVSIAARRVMESLSLFRTERNRLLHDVLYPVAATVEYLYQSPANQPDYSTVRLIIGKPFGEQNETTETGAVAEAPLSQFTANLATSVYHSPPAGVGSFRDAQAAVQFDRFLGLRTGGGEKAVASFAGYYQYMAQKGVLQFDGRELTPIVGIPLPQAANVLFDTKGSIFVAQAKVTFPIGNSGVKFPVAVSWANRSEFIKADVKKLNFGFTFDLDRLIKGEQAKE